MNYAEESLRLHEEWKGKIEVVSRVPVSTKDDLSLAYTPGVAQPCLEIQKDPPGPMTSLGGTISAPSSPMAPPSWVWETLAPRPVCL